MRLIITIFILLAFATSSGALDIYVSPLGSDNNPGTFSNPIASLEKANDILEIRKPNEDCNIYLISDQGNYEVINTVWTYYNKNHATTITSYPDSIRALFTTTEFTGDAFITFSIENGDPTNINITNIEIRDCSCRAFLFRGDPKQQGKWNGYNRIENCFFKNIGNYKYPDQHVAYSVIGFVNSRHNLVSNCYFQNIKNHTAATYPQKRIKLENSKRGKKKYKNILEYESSNKRASGHNPNLPIIGIYFAHHCDSNLVENNIFRDVKGDVIRIRDNCTNLVFRDNEIILSGWSAAITSWHNKHEVQSQGVLIANNCFIGNWLYGVPVLFKDLITRSSDDIFKQLEVIVIDNEVRGYDRLH